jgi:hypothetical protein
MTDNSEEILKELKKINNQLNPLPRLLKGFLWLAVIYWIVAGVAILLHFSGH